MLISPEEYLNLTDQLALFQLKSRSYEAENFMLKQEITKHKETIQIMANRIAQQNDRKQKQEEDLKSHIDKNTNEVIEHLTISHRKEIEYFEQEIRKLMNDANVLKIRQIEKKLVENRFINHEMVDFYQKTNTLFMVLNKTRSSPSVSELYKWISVRKAEELTNAFTTTSRNASRVASSDSNNNSRISKMPKASLKKIHSSSYSNLYEIDLRNDPSKLKKSVGKQNGPKLMKTSTKRTADTTTNRKPPMMKSKKETTVSRLFEETESIHQKPNFENEAIRNLSQKTKQKYFSNQKEDK